MLIYYGHPFSSYTWKVLIALYEKGIEFDYRSVDPAFPDHMPELRAHWPVGQFPLLVHDGVPWFESSIIPLAPRQNPAGSGAVRAPDGRDIR